MEIPLKNNVRSRRYTWKIKTLLLFSPHGFLARKLVRLSLICHPPNGHWICPFSTAHQ